VPMAALCGAASVEDVIAKSQRTAMSAAAPCIDCASLGKCEWVPRKSPDKRHHRPLGPNAKPLVGCLCPMLKGADQRFNGVGGPICIYALAPTDLGTVRVNALLGLDSENAA
jgi:hypothetical protein